MDYQKALLEAFDDDDLDKFKSYLKAGVNVNFVDSQGDSPLHIAVDFSIDGTIQTGGKQGDEPLEFIIALLEYGADIHLKNINGESPLDWAINYKSKKVIKCLQEFNP